MACTGAAAGKPVREAAGQADREHDQREQRDGSPAENVAAWQGMHRMLLAGSTVAAAPTGFGLWWQRRQAAPRHRSAAMSCRRLGLTGCRTQPDLAGSPVLHGQNLLRVAGPAGDRQVGVVGDRLGVAHVALAAVGRLWRECPYCALGGGRSGRPRPAWGRSPPAPCRERARGRRRRPRRPALSQPWQARHNALECRAAAGVLRS